MSNGKAVAILYRGEHERHLEILRQAVRAVADSGMSSVCLAPAGTFVPDHLADFVHLYEPGADDNSRIASYIRHQLADLTLSRVIALAEQDVERAALLRQVLGIPGLTPRETVCFRDKNAMAATAAEEGLLTAESCQPHTLKTVEEFANRVGFPVVIKPFNGVSCTSTYKVSSNSELERLWPLIEERRHDFRVEAFVHGRQFHVDCVLRDGEVVFEAVSEYTATILDNLGSGPLGSVTHVNAQAEPAHLDMMHQNREIVRRFGLSTGIVHTEFYVRDDGAIIFGETAARMAGGYIATMYEAAFGIELAYTWIRTEIDPAYTWKAVEARPAAAEFLWTGSTGIIESLTSRDELLAGEGVHDVKLWKQPGDAIAPTEGSRGQDLGYVSVTGSAVKEARARIAEVRSSFSVTCG
ncbi:ATP-grasp domain-containing protein [Streptomyces sp. NPDC053728]|uniref:ATP-grasp domain-containing protein n=1 Tax=Streptomyces sp. NPDC053728 TaxID=3155534 RepID=UPI003435626E